MKSPENKQCQEAQTLLENLHQHLISLAASLKGRLTDSEKDALAEVFQAQLYLQILVDEFITGTHSDTETSVTNQPASDEQPEAFSLHEIQNILTQILLYSKLIHQETTGHEEPEVAEYATEITQIVKHTLSLTEQPEEPLFVPIMEPDFSQGPHNEESLLWPAPSYADMLEVDLV